MDGLLVCLSRSFFEFFNISLKMCIFHQHYDFSLYFTGNWFFSFHRGLIISCALLCSYGFIGISFYASYSLLSFDILFICSVFGSFRTPNSSHIRINDCVLVII